jgi:predicted short-subunit dehydrogenase-like oxidoreductase (DUF2520 family)
MQGSYFCIEGDRRAVKVARKLARDLGGRPFELPTHYKGLYHAAAVMVSGGLVALISIGLEALHDCGLAERQAHAVLMPLVAGTVANVSDMGPARALTGPVRRGDISSIRRNLDSLTEIDRGWADLYRALAERAALLAERTGTPTAKLEALRRELKKPGGKQRKTKGGNKAKSGRQ